MTTLRSQKLAQQRAERCAEDVIRRLNISSLPIDPSAIAAKHGISVVTMSQDSGISGVLIKSGDSFGIGYSTRIQNEGLARFTIGHELGHYFLAGHVDYLFQNNQSIHCSGTAFSSSELHEREADFFSAALLMPEFLFVPALRRTGKGFSAIKQLAELCVTSLTATSIRFANFAEDPLAVIVSAGNRIDFCGLSPSLADVSGVSAFKKGDFLPAGTRTERFNMDQNNAGTCNEVGVFASLDDWFEDAPQIEMKEDVVGLGNYGKTLTVLFTEEIIEDEADERE